MIKIKRFLYKILGLENYLLVISKVFFLSYNMGLLRNNKEYFCHYQCKKIIKESDTIIDIGANLGYYSRIFAKLTKKTGKVYAIEPVTPFRKVLKINTKKFEQLQIMPYALGSDNEKKVKLGLPVNDNYLKHGFTKIIDKNANQKNEHEFDATMRTPISLFGNIEKLNYIKCDIEGYEGVVIPEFLPIIKKFMPTIQIETDGENRKNIISILKPLGYKIFYANSNKFEIYDEKNPVKESGDLFFSVDDL